MSYTPTTWQTGDTITAAALNKMEQGIANASSGGSGGILVVNVAGSPGNPDLFVCDKTAGEMFAADFVVLSYGTTKTIIKDYVFFNPDYVFTDVSDNAFTAATANDYPSCDMS